MSDTIYCHGLGFVRAVRHVLSSPCVDAPRDRRPGRSPVRGADVPGDGPRREGSPPGDPARTLRWIDRAALAVGTAGWAAFWAWDCWR